jgi:hypothetical protein
MRQALATGILFVMLAATLSGQTFMRMGSTELLYTQKAAVELVNELITAVQPNTEHFQRFPPAVQDALAWLGEQSRPGGLVEIQPASWPDDPAHGPLMGQAYREGRHQLGIMLEVVFYTQRLQLGRLKGIDRKMVNSFALGLFHEAIHMEDIAIRGDNTAEEQRAWRKTIVEGILPMIAASEPLDDNLRLAAEKLDDPGFDQWVRSTRTLASIR